MIRIPATADFLAMSAIGVLLIAGCNNDAEILKSARQKKNEKQKIKVSVVDHLGEADSYLRRLVELETAAATRQINYHLNAWIEEVDPEVQWQRASLLDEVKGDSLKEIEGVRFDSRAFIPSDLNYLRESYLEKEVVQWVTRAPHHDSVLAAWVEDGSGLASSRDKGDLQRACKLFEWVIRNIRLESDQIEEAERAALPRELKSDAVGYRQTTLQCLWRGTGDGVQRSRVFLRLCHHASIDAAMLGTRGDQDSMAVPRFVGVRVGHSIYLFDVALGIHVPGPDQVGIATLEQARSDRLIIRRMQIPGLFEYPITSSDLEEVIAMFDPPLESLCWRMSAVETGLTGDRRMRLSFDQELPERFNSLDVISGVAFWPIGIQARQYQSAIERAKVADLLYLHRYQMRWGMLDSDFLLDSEFSLPKGRWKHLVGQFSRIEDVEGARKTYMEMRVPDKEIDDIAYNVMLQRKYGIRQGEMSVEQFQMQIKLIQSYLRLGKQLATFWLALIQFEDEQYGNAATWHEKRVLGREYESPWADAARYNVARAYEQLGELAKAIEKYKSDDDTQEHGNRVRARLVARMQDASN